MLLIEAALSMEDRQQLIVDVFVYVVDHTDAGMLESLDPVIKQSIPPAVDVLFSMQRSGGCCGLKCAVS